MQSAQAPGRSYRFYVALLAALALPFCLFGLAWTLAIGLGYQGRIKPPLDSFAWDWSIFYAVARAIRDGNLLHVYDQVWLGQALQSMPMQGLRLWMPYPGFHYPPTFLLILLPFGWLSFGASFALAQLIMLLGLGLVLARRYGTKSLLFRFCALSLLLCPATTFNIVSGQDSLLVAALFILGFTLLDDRPAWAGIVFGAASFKPQLALMVPFALLALGNWRAIVGAMASAGLLILASLLVFGPEIWEQWSALLFDPRQDVAYTGIDWGRMFDDSVFTIATLLGGSKVIANAAQIVATAAAALSVFAAYRRPLSSDTRLAVFMAASVVGSPHVSQYDMILLAFAATMYARRLMHSEIRPSMKFVVPCLAWLLPVLCPPKLLVTGYLAPFIVFALIAALLAPHDNADQYSKPVN